MMNGKGLPNTEADPSIMNSRLIEKLGLLGRTERNALVRS